MRRWSCRAISPSVDQRSARGKRTTSGGDNGRESSVCSSGGAMFRHRLEYPSRRSSSEPARIRSVLGAARLVSRLTRRQDERSGVGDGCGQAMSGWIGVDLDGTLAEYHGWKGVEHIGPPIPEMVARVKQWLAEGRDVRIFTARCSEGDQGGALTYIC